MHVGHLAVPSQSLYQRTCKATRYGWGPLTSSPNRPNDTQCLRPIAKLQRAQGADHKAESQGSRQSQALLSAHDNSSFQETVPDYYWVLVSTVRLAGMSAKCSPEISA